MIGPGKYDDLCTEARIKAKAEGAMLMIFNGEKGEGFECQCTLPIVLVLPEILRDIANQIESDHKSGKL